MLEDWSAQHVDHLIRRVHDRIHLESPRAAPPNVYLLVDLMVHGKPRNHPVARHIRPGNRCQRIAKVRVTERRISILILERRPLLHINPPGNFIQAHRILPALHLHRRRRRRAFSRKERKEENQTMPSISHPLHLQTNRRRRTRGDQHQFRCADQSNSPHPCWQSKHARTRAPRSGSGNQSKSGQKLVPAQDLEIVTRTARNPTTARAPNCTRRSQAIRASPGGDITRGRRRKKKRDRRSGVIECNYWQRCEAEMGSLPERNGNDIEWSLDFATATALAITGLSSSSSVCFFFPARPVRRTAPTLRAIDRLLLFFNFIFFPH